MRKNALPIKSLSALYVGVAILALPFIVFGLGFHVSGFDCSDGSWADSITLAERDLVYRSLGRRVRIGLAVVGLIGVVPMAMLGFGDRNQIGRGGIALMLLTLAVWALYGLTYVVSFSMFVCVDGTFTG